MCRLNSLAPVAVVKMGDQPTPFPCTHRLFFARATAKAFQDKEKQERVKALLPSYKPGKLIPKDTSLTVQQGGCHASPHQNGLL